MSNFRIQDIWQNSYADYCRSGHFQSQEQRKASRAILACKSGRLGINVSECSECGHMEFHKNSCRNRNCPICQAVRKELWVDQRRAEVIGSPYFHVVFTLPHELNPLLFCNQKLLYGLLHKCCAQTLLELSADKKYLGAQPGIIQVLHTWNQELGYHVHMHCIISGAGLTPDRRIRSASAKFFIPVRVLRDKFKGKYLSLLDACYQKGELVFSSSCSTLQDPCIWKTFKNSLYEKDWCPYIKETFNGFGNAIEYLGRYTHRVAISNNRILSVTETEATFSARGKKPGDPKREITMPGDPKREITISHEEFIRRFLMHVLPAGFQKIRYYGFLNNRMKSRNLKIIFRIQGGQRFRQRYAGLSMAELLKAVWNIDLSICPECGCASMQQLGRSYAPFP